MKKPLSIQKNLGQFLIVDDDGYLVAKAYSEDDAEELVSTPNRYLAVLRIILFICGGSACVAIAKIAVSSGMMSITEAFADLWICICIFALCAVWWSKL